MLLFLAVQKLSALSASLARVVSAADEEAAELDQFPIDGVRKPVHTHYSLNLTCVFYMHRIDQMISLSYVEEMLKNKPS